MMMMKRAMFGWHWPGPRYYLGEISAISSDSTIGSLSPDLFFLLFPQVARAAALDWTQRLKVVMVEVEDLVVT